MSNVEKTPQQRKIEWEEKYGGMSGGELNRVVGDMLSGNLDGYYERKAEAEAQRVAKERAITYPQIVKAIPDALSRIEKYKNMPKALEEKKKKALNDEFTNEVKFERETDDPVRREIWVSERLVKWMRNDPQYLQAKQEFTQATNDYSKYVYLKEKWEQENADIIEAERIRSKRAELMQADPETLRALGITPEVKKATVSKAEDDSKDALRVALRAIHPSASDAEIDSMIRLV